VVDEGVHAAEANGSHQAGSYPVTGRVSCPA
jgi:hypothetical protein